MVDYLVKSIGFSEREAIAIFAKVRPPFNSISKPEQVVEFLKTSGSDGTQIRNLVAGLLFVLKNNVDKTLSPKIRGLQDFGFYGSDLGLIVSRNPHIIARNLETAMFPGLQVLKSLFGSDENVVAFMLKIKVKKALTIRSLKQLPANIMLLQSSGVTDDKIVVMLSKEFSTFCNKWDKMLLKRVEEKIGIPRTSAMFIYGISALTKKSETMIQSWLQVFRSYCWSETEISTLLQKHPLCLKMSESMFKEKYVLPYKDELPELYVKMGYSPSKAQRNWQKLLS